MRGTNLCTRLGRTFVFGLSAAVVAIIAPAAHAAVTVYLNFDSGGANTFLNDLNTAATTAGLGANYFNAADVGVIKTKVQQQMTSIYGGFDLTFTQTSDPAATSVKFAEAGSGFGAAPFDWRNASFASNTKAARIFTRNFDPTLNNAATKAQNIDRISIGLGGTGAHELAHTFGLDHEDSYGVPGITPANYANTGGLQNTQIMATGPTGLSDDRSTPRSFGQLERAKLEYSNSVGTAVPFLATETGAAHNTAATAQLLTFASIPTSGLLVRDVGSCTIGAAGEQDWYRFTTLANTPLTVQAFSYLDATTKYYADSVDTFLQIYRADGTTLVASDDDMYYRNNDITSTATKQSLDAWVLNQPLPATETYYIKVTGTGADTTGSYELFVAIPEPGSMLLIGAMSILTMRRRLR
jgi:hypothetical protein